MEIVDSLLEILYAWGKMMPRPFESKHGWARRLRGINKSQFERGVRHLAKTGLIRVVNKNDQRFIELTQAGQLRVLLKKAKDGHKEKWDGKWRLVMFDIPEVTKDKRHLFRALLKINGFYKLQASVYINPYPLNREAVRYLNESGLIGYIRILRVDELDNDKNLKKYFNLK